MAGVVFSGITQIAGEPDTGKTMFAWSTGASPEDTVFIDDDVKGASIVAQIEDQGHKIGHYVNLMERGRDMKEIQFHMLGLTIIKEIEEKVAKERAGKRFEVLIWDTWARFENTFWPWVASRPQEFKQFWSPNGKIKGAEQWNVSFVYEAEFMQRLQKLAKLVIITSHLKPEVVAGTDKRTGKFIPDCKKPVIQKCYMRVYLRHNPNSPAPIGLILKRPSKQIVTDDGVEIVSVLPRRVVPFTWKKIREYWENPIGDRQPTPEEMPNEYELSILDGTLTEDQKEIMRMQEGIDEEITVAPEAPLFTEDQQIRAKTMKEEGATTATIAKELGVGIPVVMKMLVA
jgi:hypothetical protein